MADRFPLILNTSTNQIQEIASGDNLDLTGSGINNAGVITATSLDISGDLDVDGHINLDNVSIAGVTTGTTINATTFVGNGDFVELDVDGHTNLDNVSIAGVVTATTFSGSGASLTGITNTNISNSAAIALSKLATGALPAGITVSGSNITAGSIHDSDVNASAAIAGTKISPDFGSQNVVTTGTLGSGNLTITGTEPKLFLNDSNHENDYYIGNGDGTFVITDNDAGVTRMALNASGQFDFYGNVDCNNGLDVTGNATVSGNLSVGGVLTYEDVTNVDSVGIVTARQGVRLGVDGTSSANYISVGAGNDLKIWHQSSNNHSYISETGSGSLIVLADDFYVQDTSTNTMISAKEGAEVNLHYNGGTPKLSTTNTGVTITGTASATTFVGALTGTASGNATISTNADNRIITGGSGNALSGEANLTWDGTKLEVKTAFGGGGGTGLVLNDSTSTGANEGMNIQWQSGTDKQSDQCRIGQFSNATGSGSNLDFYTNAGDSGSSTRRLRITHDGKLGINQLDIDADLHVATAGSSEQDGTLKVGGSENSLGLVLDYDQSGYTTTNITANPTYSSSGSILKIRTNAGDNPNQLVLKGDSFVGIGTDDPQRRLNIVHRSSSAYSDSGFSGGGPISLRIHNPEGTDNQGVGYHAGLEFVVSGGATSYGQLGYVRSGNNVGDFFFKHRTGGSSYAETTRIRHNGHLVNRGPMYSIWTETVQTPNGGSQPTQFIEDCYGQWICVAKIHNVQALQGNMSSTRTINVTTADATATEWSANWGDTNPSAVRYISASDWNYWRETRVLDWMVGIPHDRLWKQYYTNGQASGMPVVASKYGWTNVGAWDGFGRWRNPGFTNWRMSDNMTGVSIADTFFTTAGQTMNLYGSANDAKFGAHWRDSTAGQDDHVSVGYGWDDGQFGRIDNFPATNNTDMTGTDKPEYGLWIFLSMDGQKHP